MVKFCMTYDFNLNHKCKHDFFSILIFKSKSKLTKKKIKR